MTARITETEFLPLARVINDDDDDDDIWLSLFFIVVHYKSASDHCRCRRAFDPRFRQHCASSSSRSRRKKIRNSRGRSPSIRSSLVLMTQCQNISSPQTGLNSSSTPNMTSSHRVFKLTDLICLNRLRSTAATFCYVRLSVIFQFNQL